MNTATGKAIKKARKISNLKRRLSIEEILYYVENGWVLKGFNSTFLVKGKERINIYTGFKFRTETVKI